MRGTGFDYWLGDVSGGVFQRKARLIPSYRLVEERVADDRTFRHGQAHAAQGAVARADRANVSSILSQRHQLQSTAPLTYPSAPIFVPSIPARSPYRSVAELIHVGFEDTARAKCISTRSGASSLGDGRMPGYHTSVGLVRPATDRAHQLRTPALRLPSVPARTIRRVRPQLRRTYPPLTQLVSGQHARRGWSSMSSITGSRSGCPASPQGI